MKKSRSVVVVTVATIGLAIGCAQQEQQAVCVDSARRVAERYRCENDRSGRYFWHYHSAYGRTAYPVVGSRARTGGTLEAARGATVARGGFGTTARGHTVGA